MARPSPKPPMTSFCRHVRLRKRVEDVWKEFRSDSDAGIGHLQSCRCFVLIITGERGEGSLTRHGLEEYVSDAVILLDHRVHDQVSTRRLRVVKYRGCEPKRWRCDLVQTSDLSYPRRRTPIAVVTSIQ